MIWKRQVQLLVSLQQLFRSERQHLISTLRVNKERVRPDKIVTRNSLCQGYGKKRKEYSLQIS